MSLFERMNQIEEQFKSQKNTPGSVSQVLGTSDVLCSRSHSACPDIKSSQLDSAERAEKGTEEVPFTSPLKGATSNATKSFWNTVAPRGLKPRDLVWAPYYRIKDRLMPARICSAVETATVAHIPMPIPTNEVAVEFICMEEMPETRILCVFKNKIVPYWNSTSGLKKGIMEAPDHMVSTWNQDQIDLMHKALQSKYTIRVADRAFETAISRANEFLRLALENASHSAAVLVQESSSADAISPVKSVKPLGPAVDIFEIGAHAKEVKENAVATEHLALGDEIEYYDAMFADKKHNTKIIGFSGDSKIPLILQNDDILRAEEEIKKKNDSRATYKKISDFLLPATSMSPGPTSAKKRTASSLQKSKRTRMG